MRAWVVCCSLISNFFVSIVLRRPERSLKPSRTGHRRPAGGHCFIGIAPPAGQVPGDAHYRPVAEAGRRPCRGVPRSAGLAATPLPSGPAGGSGAPQGIPKKKGLMRLHQALSVIGGEGGIRTHGSVATTPDFESGTFDHSATSPVCRASDSSREIRVFYFSRPILRARPGRAATLPAPSPIRRHSGSSPAPRPACGPPPGPTRSGCAPARSCPPRS